MPATQIVITLSPSEDSGLEPLSLDHLNERELRRINEVAEHHLVSEVVVEGRDHEFFLIATVTLYANGSRPVYIDCEGDIAFADDGNRPRYQPTFANLFNSLAA